MGQILKGLATAALVVGLFANPAAAGESDAGIVVRGFQSGLLDVMKHAEMLGVKGRYEQLRPIIRKSFHLPLMVATASSPYWRAGTAQQRQRLVRAFQRMSVATVATLFDEYGGETFRVVRTRPTAGPTVLVDTQILRPAKDPIDITYVAATLRKRWWIIDIVVEGGISEVKVRRNEYLKPLKEGGLDRLVEALTEQATRLLSGREAVAAHE